ncbi:MAG: sigma 54-interacting transcriptional regulator [Lentisphaeria bacterium]|nr:sigma 54-interacting transcriptional regulator [Lentisphaeria bacterium]
MLFTKEEKRLAEAIGSLNYTNPFTPKRLEQEHAILGRDASSNYVVWHNQGGKRLVNRNISPIYEVCNELVNRLMSRMPTLKQLPTVDEMRIYDEMVLYWLFEKHRVSVCELMHQEPQETHYECYQAFLEDFDVAIRKPPRRQPSEFTPEKVFAVIFQIHRAFYHIFEFIAGGSLEAAQMRADIWQSIFTYDIYRYNRLLFDRMNNVTTLITGESGTGKELVARAIAFSQYIPFDGKTCRFAEPYADAFRAVQLSAMPQNMIESELFGHIKGSYTGAIADHQGYLEICSPHDLIFLDEIGEISVEVQIKLLRVLQNRTFQRIGDVHPLTFKGKIIAATNQDLHQAVQNGAFRSDLFYRLCSDSVSTVPLRRLVNGSESELRQFVTILALRILGAEQEAEQFADESCAWIVKNLGLDYPWPGNVRELEQCMRNLLIRGTYRPSWKTEGCHSRLAEQLRDCHLTADQLLAEYMKAVFEREGGNLAKTATAAGVDRRTVRKYLGDE